MSALEWIGIGAAAIVGGWMLFDGLHALRTGAYVGPSLSPWARLLSLARIDPVSKRVRILFVAYGSVYLLAALAYLVRAPAAPVILLVVAALGLWYLPFGTLLNLLVIVIVLVQAPLTSAPTTSAPRPTATWTGSTASPIEHLVVIVQENVSYDHYFATYPTGDPSLIAPDNPNAAQPFRLGPEQARTCDQFHSYETQLAAVNGGRMDRFVEAAGNAGDCPNYGYGTSLPMAYYDGDTVTAMWNYAAHFAMSDSFFATTYGPSTPGVLNLVAGQTGGFAPAAGVTADGHVFADPEPVGDVCAAAGGVSVQDPANQTIGDLLSMRGVSWGWFQGGFADCSATHVSMGGVESADYVAHHNPFQYYPRSANLAHVPPASVDEIGHAGQANHVYDLESFWAAADAGSLPAVSFLKAPAYQDGHPGYSSPLDEQRFLVETLNRLQSSDQWLSTAVIIAYDDSGGWYDSAYGPIQSTDPGRVGLGPRLPLLVISPFVRVGLVDHTLTQQSSITRFIEDNWMLGRLGHESTDERAGSIDSLFDFTRRAEDSQPLILDPVTGEVVG